MVVLEIAATVTRRGQTTMPAAIRKSLDVSSDGGSIVYRLEDDGQVTVAKFTETEDPAISAFLSFIGKDLVSNPGHLRSLTSGWLAEISQLVDGVEINLEEALKEEDE